MAKEKKGRGQEIFGPDYSPVRIPPRSPPAIRKPTITQARKKLFMLYKTDLDSLDRMYYGKHFTDRTQTFKDEVFLSFAGTCPKLAQYYENYFDCSVQFRMWKRAEGLTEVEELQEERIQEGKKEDTEENEEKEEEEEEEEEEEDKEEEEEEENAPSIEDDEDPDDKNYSTESSSDSSSDDSVEPEVPEIKETSKKGRKNIK